MFDAQEIGIIVVVFIVAIAIFFALREFWCWYWKINERRDLLQQILERLEGQGIGQRNIGESGLKNVSASSKMWACPQCGAMNTGKSFVCADCKYSLT